MRDIFAMFPEVQRSGFFFSPSFFSNDLASSSASLVKVAKAFGSPNKGRHGQIVEVLTPQNPDEAHRNSLSAQYGKDNFPFHIDTAHYQMPSRYLVFACIACHGNIAPTLLAHTSDLKLERMEKKALEIGVFLVKNGRHSFYTNIKQTNSPFFRWDPGCMHAQDKHAELSAEVLSHYPYSQNLKRIDWSEGALLIVDNWNMLHARGSVKDGHGERTLLRSTIQ